MITTIIEDTRNQIGKHKNINKQLADMGIKVEREFVGIGDYTLPLDRTITIDTKSGMQEVYGNIIQDHKRFKSECLKAQVRGAKLIILVEEPNIETLEDVAKWKNPRYDEYFKIKNAQARGKMMYKKIAKRPPVKSDKLSETMRTIQKRYCIDWVFCDKSETGAKIVELLTK